MSQAGSIFDTHAAELTIIESVEAQLVDHCAQLDTNLRSMRQTNDYLSVQFEELRKKNVEIQRLVDSQADNVAQIQYLEKREIEANEKMGRIQNAWEKFRLENEAQLRRSELKSAELALELQRRIDAHKIDADKLKSFDAAMRKRSAQFDAEKLKHAENLQGLEQQISDSQEKIRQLSLVISNQAEEIGQVVKKNSLLEFEKQNLVTKIAEVEQSILAVKATSALRERNLQSELVREIEALKSNETKLNYQIQESLLQQESYREELQKANLTRKDLESHVKASEQEQSQVRKSLEIIRVQHGETQFKAQKERELFLANERKFKRSIELLKTTISELNQKLGDEKRLADKKDCEQRQELVGLADAITDREKQIAVLRIENSELQKKIDIGDMTLANIQATLAEVRSEGEAQRTQLRQDVVALKKQLDQAAENRAQSQNQLNQLQDQIEALQTRHKETLATVDDCRHTIFKQLVQLREKGEELAVASAEKNELRGNARDLELQFQKKNQMLEAQLQDRHLELENEFQSKLKKLATEVQDQKASLEHAEAERHRREAQLRNYAQALTKEKHELTKEYQRLIDETQSVRALNPLKDYLDLTEFELEKVEIQLKKTPEISNDRPRYEAYLSELVEQRNFLRQILEASQKKLDQQIGRISQNLKSGQWQPIPPLPPSLRS